MAAATFDGAAPHRAGALAEPPSAGNGCGGAPEGGAMVMSQADIDALIAGQAPAGEEDASPAEDDDPSAATEGPGAAEEQPAEADAAPAVRSWSASATTETDKLSIRMGEVESRLKAVETADGGSADQGAIDELRGALARANATVERLSAEVQQLTLQSQASLGFDAQHTFDCPSCGSHGTIAVPVSCTSCGHEAEWGFWPGQ